VSFAKYMTILPRLIQFLASLKYMPLFLEDVSQNILFDGGSVGNQTLLVILKRNKILRNCDSCVVRNF
jgi:hypothetical protein